MDSRAISVLELDKILARLQGYAAFSVSQQAVQALRPSPDEVEVRARLARTAEARFLLNKQPGAGVGGARDVRPYLMLAERGGVLDATQFVELRATLQAALALRKAIKTYADELPHLSQLAEALSEQHKLIAALNRVLDDNGFVLDAASARLSETRRELRKSQARLQSKLQSLLSDSRITQYLQEALITTRAGRYVLPVKAEARGRVDGIIHDQSSSGATLFIEPMATVPINNQIKELELAEEEEIRRILAELSQQAALEAELITWTVEALGALDVALAMARYAGALRANAPTLYSLAEGQVVQLYGARHPLLDQRQVVPIDMEMEPGTQMLIITGPNTGGKTVTLKTVGLLAMMAQCGMHIPAAAGSTLSIFSSIYADIGDEQSIEQSLSTFSGHMTNIISILGQAGPGSLVVLDELGSGTDPTEGAALARAILDELLRRGVMTFVATHYPELKTYAHNTSRVVNASMEFNLETLSPTYRLMIGVPGRSNALAIASRLGLPAAIIEAARGDVGKIDLEIEALLDELQRSRRQAAQTEQRLAEAEAEVEALRAELRERLAQIDAERRKVIERTREKAGAELSTLREEVAQLRRRLAKMAEAPARRVEEDVRPAAEAIETLQTLAETLEERVAEPALAEALPLPVQRPRRDGPPLRALRQGDVVYVPKLNMEGQVTNISGGGNVEVQVGTLRVRVDADEIELRGAAPPKTEPQYEISIRRPEVKSPGLELHLRGMTLEEALPLFNDYIDRAYIAGLPWVRIIHGKGTGKLRRAIHDALRRLPFIENYGPAPAKEGGDGVTVVRFASLV